MGFAVVGTNGSAYHRVQIFFSAIEGTEEAAFCEVRNGAGDAAFVDAALLEGLGGRERVLRVQRRVAKVEIELAVIVVGGGLGDDFHLSAAGPVVVRRVGILVDAHFLHGRGGDGDAIGFDAVDDQAGAAGGGGAVIKEGAHGGDVVVVEDGQRLQVFGGHDRGVVIVFGRGEVFAAVGVDAYVGGDGGDGKDDVQRRGKGVRWGACCRRNDGRNDYGVVHRFKARLGYDEGVVAGVGCIQAKAAVVAGVACASDSAAGIDEVDFCAGNDRAGGISDDALESRSRRRWCRRRRVAGEENAWREEEKDKGGRAHDAESPRQIK